MSDLIETSLGYISQEDENKWNLIIHYMAPIIDFYSDPSVMEIMVNRYDSIFIEGTAGIIKTTAAFASEADLQRLVRQLSIVLGQDSEKLEVLDARFPDQSRACCTMPSVSPTGATMTLRCAPKVTLKFSDLITFGSLSEEMAQFIEERVIAEDNIIISGSTGSGKTTLLRALADYIPDRVRLIVCEDTQELFLKLPNIILMEAAKRKGNEIDLPALIKTSLRQRPDRIFVGEIRDAFACDAFLQAINTGHNGYLQFFTGERVRHCLNTEIVVGYVSRGALFTQY